MQVMGASLARGYAMVPLVSEQSKIASHSIKTLSGQLVHDQHDKSLR